MATSALEKKTHADYTVGWVCALAKEQTAALTMLDTQHVDLDNPPNDRNVYTLGSIGPFNVVIACIPEGEMGTNPAATVATRMINTFPCIKIGLMVGIGGGIPRHVRLGDVVVSCPSGQYPGVVQWDFGKARVKAGGFEISSGFTDGIRGMGPMSFGGVRAGSGFQRTGCLDKPPESLRAALGLFKSKREIYGQRLTTYLREMGQKYPTLVEKYLSPDKLRDVVFKRDYVHVEQGPAGVAGDGDCPHCDRSNSEDRTSREMYKVHYGLIASGNMVIKDAEFRDQLNDDLGGEVLCIEMEAAGLMNNFPCLVIRGICDYADSHKNKAWQEHAAAVAAAYAKELLGYIQPHKLAAEPAAREVVKEKIQSTLPTSSESFDTPSPASDFSSMSGSSIFSSAATTVSSASLAGTSEAGSPMSGFTRPHPPAPYNAMYGPPPAHSYEKEQYQRSQVESLGRQLALLRTERDAEVANRPALERNMSTLYDRFEAEHKRRVDLEQEAAVLRGERSVERAKLAALGHDLKTFQARFEEEHARCFSLERDLDALRTQKDAALGRASSIESNLSTLAPKLEQERARCSALERELDAFRTEKAAELGRVPGLERELQTLTARISEEQAQNVALGNQLNTLLGEKDEEHTQLLHAKGQLQEALQAVSMGRDLINRPMSTPLQNVWDNINSAFGPPVHQFLAHENQLDVLRRERDSERTQRIALEARVAELTAQLMEIELESSGGSDSGSDDDDGNGNGIVLMAIGNVEICRSVPNPNPNGWLMINCRIPTNAFGFACPWILCSRSTGFNNRRRTEHPGPPRQNRSVWSPRLAIEWAGIDDHFINEITMAGSGNLCVRNA